MDKYRKYLFSHVFVGHYIYIYKDRDKFKSMNQKMGWN